MTFFQRVGYYLGGLSIGLIFLAFFLSGKKTSCDYGPSARVKKNIRIKKIAFTKEANDFIKLNLIDTVAINHLLSKGSVNFSESNTKLDSCKIYIIEGNYEEMNLKLKIENCEKIATIKTITIK